MRGALGGGPRLFIKRDDCTGLATGGNKTRKLEFLLADAIGAGAELVVTQGAVQSNHVRQTAAAAAKAGLGCVALLERRVDGRDPSYETTGNVLLDDVLGARVEFLPGGTDMNAAARERARSLTDGGTRAYFIPGGGSNEIGALGYMRCADELAGQCAELGIGPDWVVHATGSAGTQAGLVAGMVALGGRAHVLGASVRHPRELQQEVVADLANRTLAHAGLGERVAAGDILVDDGFVGPGYGVPTAATLEAIRLLARHEGVLLDPVYSGKGFACLVSRIRAGEFPEGDTVVFVHTGGAASLFAYEADLAG